MENQRIIWKFRSAIPRHQWSRLKKFRQMQGVRFTELALKAGISPNTVFLHEMGFPGSPEVRKKICDVLGVPEDQIYPVRVEGDVVIESGENLKIEVIG